MNKELNNFYVYDMPPKWNQKVIKKIKIGLAGVVFGSLGFPFFIMFYPIQKIDKNHLIFILVFGVSFWIILYTKRVINYLKQARIINKLTLEGQHMELLYISDPFVNWFRKLFSYPDNLIMQKKDGINIQIKETTLLRNNLDETGLKVFSLSVNFAHKSFILLSEKEFISLKDHLDRFRKNVE